MLHGAFGNSVATELLGDMMGLSFSLKVVRLAALVGPVTQANALALMTRGVAPGSIALVFWEHMIVMHSKRCCNRLVRRVIGYQKRGRGWRMMVQWMGFPSRWNEWMRLQDVRTLTGVDVKIEEVMAL